MQPQTAGISDLPRWRAGIPLHLPSDPGRHFSNTAMNTLNTSTRPARLGELDMLRGFALFGLLLVHMVERFELYWLAPEAGWLRDLAFGVFAGKSYALLALLFGVSFQFLLAASTKDPSRDRKRTFLVRMSLLTLIGLMHGIVYRGDILLLIGTLAFPLVLMQARLPQRALPWMALFFLAQPVLIFQALTGHWTPEQPLHWHNPSLQHYLDANLWQVIAINAVDGLPHKLLYYWESGRMAQMLGLYLLGFWLARTGRLSDFLNNGVPRRTFVVFLIIGTFMAVAEEFGLRMGLDWPAQALASSYADVTAMLLQAMLLLLLAKKGWIPFRRILEETGRMTLTFYILQSVVFVGLFYPVGLGLHDVLSTETVLSIGLITFFAQGLIARIWFRQFKLGPLEGLWRRLADQIS